ncbi:hypothetical protein CY35_09G026900 [Sphagnum magellanicum]|nr:hypothetical protein CY35_09G026900 [Sphagnum magellanicum]
MGSGKRGVVLQLQLLVLLVLVVIAAAADQRHYNSESTVHENLQAGTAGDRHLASHVLRAELVHRDHLPASSPLGESSSAPKSMGERLVQAVKRSNIRRDSILRSIQARGSRSAAAAAKPEQQQHQLDAAAEYSVPVSAGNGEYLTQIGLGTPPQTFTAIVDTGSDLLWTQCLPCTSCYPQTGNAFNPSLSSTYQGLNCGNGLCQDIQVVSCGGGCEYEYGYGDGSTTNGNFATDTVTLGSGSIPDIGFGCGHTNEGSFSPAGGLLGLGQGPLSLLSQISTTVSKKFSYCLVNYNSPNTSPLIFGDGAVTSGGLAYTPIVPNAANPTYYYVGLDGVSVAGTAVDYPDGSFAIDDAGTGGVIVDSGTTITYLDTDAYNAVRTAISAALTYPLVSGDQYGLDLCFNTGGAVNAATLPSVVLHFTNADFTLAPENLFIYANDAGSVQCLAMAGSSGLSILGNVQQQDHLILFDGEAGQIGFQSTTC